jgi:hypothetical protein
MAMLYRMDVGMSETKDGSDYLTIAQCGSRLMIETSHTHTLTHDVAF